VLPVYNSANSFYDVQKLISKERVYVKQAAG
jgi:hypothetical protein